MIEFSHRNSNNNIKTNINPYVFDISSSKKATKKKAESIDLVSFIVINSIIRLVKGERVSC